MGRMLCLSGLTMAYAAVAWLGLSLAIVPGGVSPVWPATGLAIAALTLWGPRLWPAIAVGAFIANFIIAGNPVLVAAGTAAGNTLEALIGAWALRHMGVRGEVSCIRDAATLLLVGIFAPLPSVTLGALSLTLGGLSPWDSYLWVCRVGWMGSTLGNFVVLPLVLAWAGQRVPAVYDSRPLEFAGATVLIVTLTSLAFFFGSASQFGSVIQKVGLPFLPPAVFLFPPIVWALLRLRPRDAFSVMAVGCALTIILTLARTEGQNIGQLFFLQLVFLTVGGGWLLLLGAITERRHIEARLREREEVLRESEIRMRALLDASQDEILLISAGGVALAINKAAERRLAKRMGGAKPVGLHLDRLLPHEQVEWRMAIVRQVASMATPVHREMEVRSRWFECWYYPVLQPDKPVSEVALYAREITQQKKSQAELSKLYQAIQQSPTSVVITDRDGTIEYVNPKFTDVTGYTQAEAIGRNPRVLKSGHTPPERYVELWNTVTSGGVWRGEFRNKKKNGELFWELASIAPVKNGDKIINFVAVKEDITERKEIEEQLRQAQKMEAVGQLTGGIAHDFNNLLAIIIGNLQLLAERPSGDAKAREYLHDALWSARRGGELTHRLLAFARKQSLKPIAIDFNDVVRGMTDLLRRTLGANVRIQESPAPDLWKSFADRGELERALVNLAVNARDAMRNGGTLTLETRNAVLDDDYAEQHQEVTPGDYVLLAVTDTGTGMAPEVVQRVFEPFFTTKETGKGSGLGLSMVYGFVKQSGGHVSIYSRVGQGTSVKLYLPRMLSAPKRLEERFPDVAPGEFGERVVLVVEDEEKLRKVAVKMLDQLGLRCLQAETAKDALELLVDTHIDVLFTDIELPGGMNGTELAEAAQKLAPNIKVLFTTGYARETVLRDKWLQDKIPWLLKPYSHIELARELKALLAPTLH